MHSKMSPGRLGFVLGSGCAGLLASAALAQIRLKAAILEAGRAGTASSDPLGFALALPSE